MSRTFPRAFLRGCFSLFCCCSLVIFPYTGHDVHRRGHGRRRPLRGLSVVPSLISTLSPRHSSVVYCPQDSVCSMAWSCSTRRRVESNIGQVTGLASTAPPGLRLPHQNAIAATSHQCGPCAPWSRASASACVGTKQYKNRRTKFEVQRPTRASRSALLFLAFFLRPKSS